MACQWKNICPLRDLERAGKVTNIWKDKYCNTRENWRNCRRYQMEEQGVVHSDNLLPDGSLLA